MKHNFTLCLNQSGNISESKIRKIHNMIKSFGVEEHLLMDEKGNFSEYVQREYLDLRVKKPGCLALGNYVYTGFKNEDLGDVIFKLIEIGVKKINIIKTPECVNDVQVDTYW